MKKIYIFTINGCSHCSELKKRLKDENITFNDVEITLNRPLWEQVVSQTGHDILPTVLLQDEKDGNGTVYTPGRDFQDNDEIIKIIKNNI